MKFIIAVALMAFIAAGWAMVYPGFRSRWSKRYPSGTTEEVVMQVLGADGECVTYTRQTYPQQTPWVIVPDD